MQDLHLLTVAQTADLLQAKKVSSLELAEHYLARATTHKALGAFLGCNPYVTRLTAKSADARLAAHFARHDYQR